MIFAPPHNIQSIPTPLLWVRRGWRVPWRVDRAQQSAAPGAIIYAGAVSTAAADTGEQSADIDTIARVTADGSYRVTPDGSLRITGYALDYTPATVTAVAAAAAQSCTLGKIIWTGTPTATLAPAARQTITPGALIYAPQAGTVATATAQQTATPGEIVHRPGNRLDSEAITRQSAAPGIITYTIP
jgi:hypothetical protein